MLISFTFEIQATKKVKKKKEDDNKAKEVKKKSKETTGDKKETALSHFSATKTSKQKTGEICFIK